MNRGILINTSNLHIGGGVQVAASLVGELVRAGKRQIGLVVALSSEVKANVAVSAAGWDVFDDVMACDVHGFALLNRRARRFLDLYNTVFTLFGPLYRWRPPFKSIVGFAQAWIIYPRNEVYGRMPAVRRFMTRLKYWVQAQFFKRADVLVVELEHVKEGLVRELGIDPARIHVVHNCVASIFSEPALWEPVSLPDAQGALRLGFLGRNYIHKNTAVFAEIVSELRQRHGIEAKIYVTFTENEWRGCSVAFRAACINVGPLKAAQCPNFYQALDAVLFASLLECFSATPLEAMAMGKPLFASDRPFNHNICGNHAWYFDPLSPEDAADKIAGLFMNGGPEASAMAAAQDHAISFSSPAARAAGYLALLGQNDDILLKG